ncbi:MAG: ATP-binding protein [Syntrophobacteraceae bacterium]|nr:ATP-binding protein [Syntrophobacteraceae bacterium]
MLELLAGLDNEADDGRLRSKLKKLMLYRLLLALFFLLVTIAVQSRRNGHLLSALFHPLYMFSCILVLFTIFGAFALRGVRRLERFTLLQLLFDLGAVTVLVFMTGGIDSCFSSLYMLVIFSAALLLHRKASLLTASASALIYGCLLDLQYFGWISPLDIALGSLHARDSGTYFFNILINTAAFFLVGFLAGYLARELQRSKLRVRQSERDLETLQTLHTSIVRSMTSGLLTVDLEGRIIFSNKAAHKMLGMKPEEISGYLVTEIFTGIDFLPVHSATTLSASRHATRMETCYNHPAGMQIVFGYSASALRKENGKTFGWLIIFTDLTKLRGIEEHFQRMERLVLAGRVAAEIAHEIKNPLAAMSGAVQMLRSETGLSPLNERLIGIVQREIERVNALVTEFLWMAKGSPQSSKIEDVAVCPVIEEIVALIRANKKATASHTISTDFRSKPLVAIDPLHLRRVLWNLLVNALEAMPAGGELSIAVELQHPIDNPDRQVRIDIGDTGCGIPDPALKRIFDPFFTTKTNGTGLGLSIVYQLVEKASGRVEVNGKQPGSGTIFSLFFPPSSSFSLAK